jgi:hypothetical protein
MSGAMGRRRWLLDGVVTAVAALAAVGCAAIGPAGPLVRPVTVDPNASFVARERHPGFALERLPDGGTGELVPATFGPTQIVRVGQQDVAWLSVGPQEIVVRGGAADDAPVLGRVVSSWQDQAVRLSIEPKGQPVVTSEAFRSGVGSGQILLSRDATMALDLKGAFTSPLLGADGKPVGWLRVRINGIGATSYEGAMPKGVSDAMAAAAMAALQKEVEFITNQFSGSNRPTDAR